MSVSKTVYWKLQLFCLSGRTTSYLGQNDESNRHGRVTTSSPKGGSAIGPPCCLASVAKFRYEENVNQKGNIELCKAISLEGHSLVNPGREIHGLCSLTRARNAAA